MNSNNKNEEPHNFIRLNLKKKRKYNLNKYIKKKLNWMNIKKN